MGSSVYLPMDYRIFNFTALPAAAVSVFLIYRFFDFVGREMDWYKELCRFVPQGPVFWKILFADCEVCADDSTHEVGVRFVYRHAFEHED